MEYGITNDELIWVPGVYAPPVGDGEKASFQGEKLLLNSKEKIDKLREHTEVVVIMEDVQ